MSLCKFFLFSESTACSSRSSVSARKSGLTKNCAKRSKAPYSGAWFLGMGRLDWLAFADDEGLLLVDVAESSK